MTIATTVLTNLPVQGEMLDENGHLTQQWRLFFQGLYVRIGGQSAPTNLALGATTDNSVTSIASLTSSTSNNTTNISNLTTTSNTNATTVSGLTTTSNTNATTVSGLTTSTNNNTTNISALTTTSNTNATTVSNLSTATNNNTTNISTLTTTSNTNATTVSNLSTATNNNTAAIATLNAAPGAVAPVTVTASPFTYKATQKGALVISGGSLRRVEVTRDGTTFYLTGALRGMFPLSTNDSIRVTYIAAPLLTYFPS